MSSPAAIENNEPAPGRMSDISQLVKARLSFLVLVTTAVGYYMGSPAAVDFGGLCNVLIGAALTAAGASALNQWWERDLDALMIRTRSRPVPAGRMQPSAALILGCVSSIVGVGYLALKSSWLAPLLAALTLLIYVLAYTPLKRITTANTIVGAIPGAIPPLIGWAAARGRIDFGAWSLFLILFLWQLPHFFPIAWICRNDYQRAGFRMLSSGDDSGARSSSQCVLYCIILMLLAGIPSFIGLAGPMYLLVELILGIALTALAFRFHRLRTVQSARQLFFGSLIYLPLLLGTLMLAKL